MAKFEFDFTILQINNCNYIKIFYIRNSFIYNIILIQCGTVNNKLGNLVPQKNSQISDPMKKKLLKK